MSPYICARLRIPRKRPPFPVIICCRVFAKPEPPRTEIFPLRIPLWITFIQTTFPQSVDTRQLLGPQLLLLSVRRLCQSTSSHTVRKRIDDREKCVWTFAIGIPISKWVVCFTCYIWRNIGFPIRLSDKNEEENLGLTTLSWFQNLRIFIFFTCDYGFLPFQHVKPLWIGHTDLVYLLDIYIENNLSKATIGIKQNVSH